MPRGELVGVVVQRIDGMGPVFDMIDEGNPPGVFDRNGVSFGLSYEIAGKHARHFCFEHRFGMVALKVAQCVSDKRLVSRFSFYPLNRSDDIPAIRSTDTFSNRS